MEFGELKPLAKALVLPPAGPLLLAFAGMVLATRRRRAGAWVAATALAALWLLSCNAVAVALSHALLPQVAPITPQQLATVQAVVVLGGGTHEQAPEYGQPQPTEGTLQRIRFAARLARMGDKPVAVASGTGWGGAGESEALVTRRVLAEDYGVAVRWLEDRSRDTRENANLAAAVLLKDGIRRVALVTDAPHMPRAARNFEQAGFEVVPAPTAYIVPQGSLNWLPSAEGLQNSRYVLHEWLGFRLT